MDREGLSWRLVRDGRAPGPRQLALDEVAAETAAHGGPCTVRVYGWARPGTLSLGYAQSADVVDWAACERRGVTVTRRRTGGGAIYHDAVGDLAYSIAAPADALPSSTAESYRLLLEPVRDALSRLGVEARLATERVPGEFRPACYLRPLHAAHDLVVPVGDVAAPGADGPGASVRKIAGSAQHRTRDAVVQHGSISVAATPEAHAAVFADGPEPSEFRERVGCLADRGVQREAVVGALVDALGEWAGAAEGEWTEGERDRARALDEVYRDERWVRGRERPDGVAAGGSRSGR